MGVRGLTTYIANRSDLYLKNYELSNSNLVIDGNSLAYQLYSRSRSNTCFGGDYDKYGRAVHEFFKLLSDCRVTPIVVFDGGYEKRKLKTIFSRMRDKLGAASRCTPNRRGAYLFPLFTRNLFEDIVRQLKIQCVRSSFEADTEIASLAKSLNCPVLSYDSDFYIFDALYIPFPTLKIHKRVRYNTHSRKRENCIKCKIYEVDAFLNAFGGMDKANLPILSVLLGNDYIKSEEFSAFFTQLKLQKGKSENTQQCKIKTVISWLKHETYESALEKIAGQFRADRRKYLIHRVMQASGSYTLVDSEIVKFFNLDRTAQQVTSTLDEIDIICDDLDEIDISSASDDVEDEESVNEAEEDDEDSDSGSLILENEINDAPEGNVTLLPEFIAAARRGGGENLARALAALRFVHGLHPDLSGQGLLCRAAWAIKGAQGRELDDRPSSTRFPSSRRSPSPQGRAHRQGAESRVPSNEGNAAAKRTAARKARRARARARSVNQAQPVPSSSNPGGQPNPTDQGGEPAWVEDLVERLCESTSVVVLTAEAPAGQETPADNSTIEEGAAAWSSVFIDNFRKCVYPPCFMDIITLNKYFFIPHIEDNSEDNAHRISRPILAIIYKILTSELSNVNSLVFYDRNEHCHIRQYILEKSDLDVPSLKTIYSLSSSEHKEILFKLLNIDQTTIKNLQYFPKKWHLILITMNYWTRNSKVPKLFIYAIILSCIVLFYVDKRLGFYRSRKAFLSKYDELINKELLNCTKSETKISDIQNINDSLDNISLQESILCMNSLITYFQVDGRTRTNIRFFDRKILHRLSEFQSCLLHVTYLNALLNKPIDTVPVSEFYNGTFLYNISVNFKRRKSALTSHIKVLLQNSPRIVEILRAITDSVTIRNKTPSSKRNRSRRQRTK